MSTPKITLKLSKSTGLGTLTFKNKTYNCGGLSTFNYPSDTTIDGYKEETHISKEFVNDRGEPSVMPYSVLWIGQKGVYFHEYPTLEGSHGCIHLLSGDAKNFYDDVTGKARVLFSWKN